MSSLSDLKQKGTRRSTFKSGLSLWRKEAGAKSIMECDSRTWGDSAQTDVAIPKTISMTIFIFLFLSGGR
jgi:hypothetical protein